MLVSVLTLSIAVTLYKKGRNVVSCWGPVLGMRDIVSVVGCHSEKQMFISVDSIPFPDT